MKLLSLIASILALGLILPGPVMACACCGSDNTWQQDRQSISDYKGKILLGLNLQGGVFDDAPAYEKSYDIKSIQKQSGKFLFQTPGGDIVFIYGDSIEHRQSDITFITNKNYKYSDEADIYHELILRGQLLLPDAIVKAHASDAPSNALKKSSKAKMVFQGKGNACIEGSELKKWILKLENNRVNFQGHGQIGSESK